MADPAIDAAQLRIEIRNKRRGLGHAQRHAAAQQLAKRVGALKIFAHAHDIAGFLAFDGEMDPSPLIERAWSMGKHVYLPVLTGNPQAHLVFAPFDADTRLKPNRFGIAEPQVSAKLILPPQRMDLVITPLVAFDATGTRMGMGGGFYDRSFAFLNNPGHLRKPHLLGVAYELQKVDALTRQPWDIPLDGIVTEEALYEGQTGYLFEDQTYD